MSLKMMELRETYLRQGFAVLDADPATQAWAQAAQHEVQLVTLDPALKAQWLRGAGTWFVGVDALPNTPSGAISGVPLEGGVIDLIANLGLMPKSWHRAQVSVVYPGYPKPQEGDSPAAAKYRETRDAAHVDGLFADGPERRRKLREPHAFVLGLPLNSVGPDAAPMSVWPGSHLIMGAAFRTALALRRVKDWPDVDLTEIYVAARRTCFDRLERWVLPVQPGQATLIHRHLLHGIAPWQAPDVAQGRQIAYFRPQFTSLADWLSP